MRPNQKPERPEAGPATCSNPLGFDFIARTAIWSVAVAVWAFLTMPQDVGLLPMWAGVPTVAGGSLILTGLGLYVAGAVSLARAKRDSLGAPEVLITRGPYRYVRNPVYLAIGMIMVGIAVLYRAWQLSAVVKTALLFTGAHIAVVFLEEPATRKRFGVAYVDYCRRVPRWIPRRPSN